MAHQPFAAARSTLVPFPLKSRAVDVRHAAALLTEKSLSDSAKTDRWARITDRLARQLGDHGFDPIVIAMELCDFEDAVDDEIAKRQLGFRPH